MYFCIFSHCSFAEKIAPSWKNTLDLIKGGSYGEVDCGNYNCSPEKKRRNGK